LGTNNTEDSPSHGETHFGYESVPSDEKAGKVAEVFRSVARRYDLMNDLMTWGLHRRWKRSAVRLSGVRVGDAALDLAGGTGDIAILLARAVGPEGSVVLADINPSMLAEAERRLAGNPLASRISLTEADAEELPFADEAFDVVTIGFGLRNVTRKERALREMLRVLRPGGRMVVLEFSRPVAWLVRPLYHAYSFAVLPALGKVFTNDAASYRYLAESIRVHPDRDTLRGLIVAEGFASCEYRTMLFGIVAAHVGVKA
jgi:demethylmenaquinone methyltransferase/2-methoxy-6-polyprenyl-1,4-benzoquinol methylase